MNTLTDFDISKIRPLLEQALTEDIGTGDLTTDLFISPDTRTTGTFLAKAQGILAGGILLQPLFEMLDASVIIDVKVEDGSPISPSDVLATISGPAAPILKGERQALNFLERLSGIATETRRYVEAVKGTGARIYDTRKTTPGLRLLEKYAVRMGGGNNHRLGLYDQILIKDNHLKLMSPEALRAALKRARKRYAEVVIELEVETLEELSCGLELGVDIILLDNMALPQLEKAVALVRELPAERRPILEASGGITLDNVRAVALTGVERISVGALTHSVTALDISLELEPSPASEPGTHTE